MASVNSKLSFLNQAPPPNYVAGLGRGASGFTTRSDIGPAREGPSEDAIAAARARRGEEPEETPGEEEANENQDPENETGLFAGTIYERDDEEADGIWDSVDAKMDERRRKHREAREKAELEKYRAERPKIQAQFADLKRGLSAVSDDEWAMLPEAGNLTGKRRKAAAARAGTDRTYAVPDSVLLGNRDRAATEVALSEEQMADGTSTSMGTATSLVEIGEARNKIFSHKLDQAGSSSSADGTASALGTSSSIDPKGYLTDLSSVAVKSNAEIGDIKKARGLLDSVIKTNPKHAPGWIAAARLEEVAGKMAIARKVIAQGCENCKMSEDVWLESARLNTRDNAKVVLAQAIAAGLTTSVKIWLKAADLETDANSKKRVIRKSLEYIPNSIKLWKELVNLEESHEDARILLSGAVAAVPNAVDLWLALARLSSPAEAQSVLNEARKKLPSSHEIWIAAARLIEQTDADAGKPFDATQAMLDKTMVAAVKRLGTAGAILSRDQWLKEAERVEREGSPATCAAIVKATIAIDVEEEDRRTVWVEDAQASLEHGCVETARAILAYTLREFPDRQSIWRLAVDTEKKHGTPESLEALLERAVNMCPKAENLWLMYAKEKWQGAHDVAAARQVLTRAFEKNMGSEEISLAAAKLEAENGEKSAASMLLQRARQEVGSARVWLKSAVFERNEGRAPEALQLVREALAKFLTFWKLHMMHAQLVEAATTSEGGANIRAAREALAAGLKACPSSVTLWVNASRLEERAGLAIRARALLEKARLAKVEEKDVLWAEAAAVEERSGNVVQAKSLLARGLQEHPKSGLLWTASIWLEPRNARRTRSADALNKTGDDARVLTTVARMFWNERKVEQARKWFDRATKANPDWGDGWAWWLKFEKQHGTDDSRRAVRERCIRAEPHHGEEWQRALKDPKHPARSTGDVLDAVAAALVITT